jgi:glycine betaine/choline ABC-type transport system substrate-binding protein
MRRNSRPRFSGLAPGVMLVTLAVVLAACGSSSKSGPSTSSSVPANSKIVVGEKDFAGAQLLSQLYGQALAAKNFKVTYKNLGPTEVTYPALKNGQVDLYGEYQGTLLTYLKGTPTSDAAATNAGVQTKVSADSIKASAASTALDVNGF